MTICLNCSNQFDGNFRNDCSQKAAIHRFTLHEWMHEIPRFGVLTTKLPDEKQNKNRNVRLSPEQN